MMNVDFIPDDSMALGQNVANIAAEALEALGRQMICQKAQDIAKQVDIYLKCKQTYTLADVMQDSTLAKIAVQVIGDEGYSAVHDTRGINIFHTNPELIGQDLHDLAYRFPQWWKIIQQSFSEECDGYYDWMDQNGTYRRKYMYCCPVYPEVLRPIGLVVAVTTFIDEFLKPSREIRSKITTLAKRVDQHNRAEHRLNLHLRAINEVSCRINSLQIIKVEELIPDIVEVLRDTFQYDNVRIYLKNSSSGEWNLEAQSGDENTLEPIGDSVKIDQGPIAWVASSGKPYMTGDTAHNPGRVWNLEPSSQYVRMALPLQIGANVFGIIDVSCNHPQTFDEIDLYTAQTLADQLAIALDNARLYLELRDLAVIEERNRIAREIHDTLAQGFAGISMNVEIAKQALNRQEFTEVERILERTRTLAKDNLSQARRSVQSLRPYVGELGELELILRQEIDLFSQEMNIPCDYELAGKPYTLSAEIRLGFLRICQEALNNVKKHAQASWVRLQLEYSPAGVTMIILDNGIGFDGVQASQTSGFGLICMQERARLMGGVLTCQSEKGRGTEIRLFVPAEKRTVKFM